MSDYWSNFNSWDNSVEILPTDEETGTEHTFVSEGNSKYITHGKSVYSTHGGSWTYQDGDVTWYQTGNLGYKQIGVSNTVIEGWNFFTVLGMSMNTTVGLGIDSYFGLRVGINFLGTVDVNVAAGVRLGKGGYYDFEDSTHWETAAQKKELLGEELKLAKKTVQLVEGEIKTISMNIDNVCKLHKISTGDIEHLALYKATLGGSFKTTCGSLTGETMLNGISVKITATTSATILSKGPAWINGAIVKIG